MEVNDDILNEGVENEGVGEMEEEEELITDAVQVEDEESYSGSETGVSKTGMLEEDTIMGDINETEVSKEDTPVEDVNKREDTPDLGTESAPIIRELELDLGAYWNNAVM